MAGITKGYIKCDHSYCDEIAEVRQANGTRASYYTVCPSCKTNQANGKARQNWILANVKETEEEARNAAPPPPPQNLKAEEPEPQETTIDQIEEEPPRPSKNAAYSVIEAEENRPKGSMPIMIVFITILAALMVPLFSQRKENKTA